MDLGKQNSSENPDSKWTNAEVKIILKYLQETSAKEAPTKQIFYKNLKERTGVTAKWDLIKEKVTNLRSTFKKPTEKRAEEMQMCPLNQQQLNEFCGGGTESWTDFSINGPGDSFISDESMRIQTVLSDPVADQVLTLKRRDVEICYSAHGAVLDTRLESSGINQSPSTSCHSSPSKSMDISKKPQEFVEKLKNFKKSSVAYLACLQAKRAEKSRRKSEWETTEHEKGMEMSEKKLVLEEEWTKAQIELKRKELELREKEIDNEEKLKILDMEKEERLRKYELELKYKSQ